MGGRWKECWTVQDCGRKERTGKKMEGMLGGVGFWKRRNEWEEDGRKDDVGLWKERM